MKPECKASGEKWVIVGRSSETRGGAIHEVVQWWTGTSWVNVERHALEFDSETEVNEYIERNREMLED